MRKVFKVIGGVVLSIILVLLIAKAWADKTYFNNYDPTLPFNVQVKETALVNDTVEFFGITRMRNFEKIVFTIDARPNEPMPVLLTMPVGLKGKAPVIVFLHGIGQSKGFLQEICTPFNQAGFAMACFDQSMQGERKIKGNYLAQAIAFRQRPWRTINDARRLIDYLQTHPQIDPQRIYLVGASYGAITGSTTTAFDKRIRAADLVVGGGNIKVLLDAPLIKEGAGNPLLHWMAKQLVSYIMKPADPIRYAAGTAGTPVLMQNGSTDSLVTPDAGKELFAALGEPKEIRWYPCNHPGLGGKEETQIIVQILDEGLAWLLEQDKPFRKEEAASIAAQSATPAPASDAAVSISNSAETPSMGDAAGE